jgi:hypothetical protein
LTSFQELWQKVKTNGGVYSDVMLGEVLEVLEVLA